MPRSEFALAVDGIQKALRAHVKPLGFRTRGRTFNRVGDDGLMHVVQLQMGASNPPGTTEIPGLRDDLHGLFTVNLGVYVPEVARHLGGEKASWVQDYDCCVRTRLGQACGEEGDLWWQARCEEDVVEDVWSRLREHGLPWVERHGTRDRLLAELAEPTETRGTGSPPRIVRAIVLVERGEADAARELLAAQARETDKPAHRTYVNELAGRLGLGTLPG